MKRPNVPSMDQIEAMLQDIADMEEAISEIKNRLKEMPYRMSTEISGHQEKVEAARYLYWMIQDISAKSISEGLLDTNVYEMTKMVGTETGTIQCDRCLSSVAFRSRSHLNEIIKSHKKDHPLYAEGYKILCDSCWKSIQNIRHEEHEKHKAKIKARVNELQTMPYQEYLRTPEWQDRRKQHLKSAGYKCQVCNEKNTILNVHHRTYERRGQEHYKDLITLCEDCHKIFHQAKKLA